MTRQCILIVLFLSLLTGGVSAQVGKGVISPDLTTSAAKSAFVSGEFIYAHIQLSKPLSDLIAIEEGRPVTLALEIVENGKSIDRDDFALDAKEVKGKSIAAFVLPIISNPRVASAAFGKNHFATYLPKAFAGLPAGNHNLQCQVKCYSYKGGNEPLATIPFALKIEAGAKAFYEKNAKESYDAMVKGIAPPSQAELDAANAKMKEMPKSELGANYFQVSFTNKGSKVINVWLSDRQSPLNINPGYTTTERIKKGKTVTVFVGEPHKAQDLKVTTVSEKDAGKTIPINYNY